METNRVIHENEDALSILLPTINHFIVFLLCHLQIHTVLKRGPEPYKKLDCPGDVGVDGGSPRRPIGEGEVDENRAEWGTIYLGQLICVG
jgi:hypothetical protein